MMVGSRGRGRWIEGARAVVAALLWLGATQADAQTQSVPPTTSSTTSSTTTSQSPSSTTSPLASQVGPGAGPSPAPAVVGPTSQPTPLFGANAAAPPKTTLLQDQVAGVRPPPFGVELFSTSNVTASLNILDPGYIMKPGDHVTLSVFGGLPDESRDTVIDTKGNLMVPGVGPVPVAGLTAAAVNSAVNAAAARVFSSSVKVYASPTTTAPITVFVTGPVINPGPYAGASSDSVLAFLQRAGGIDANRGSYRDIVVRHGGQVVAHVDLYAFLRAGELTPLRLRQDDVIVVGQQGPVVSVYGAARAPFTFELSGPSAPGDEVLYYARPRPESNYADVLGVRATAPFNTYLPLAQFAHLPLMDGDRVQFSADSLARTISVKVEGAFQGPGGYVVPRETTLGQLLARIPLDSQADRRWIHLQRVSAAFTQKQLLSEALARLQKAIYTQPSPTSAIAQANASQATSIQQYINFASQIQPVGDVALPLGADLDRVTLEPDDIIVIPFQSQVVSIGGEINEPQALIYQTGASVSAYVARAGGFSQLADRGHVLIIHPDGSTGINGRVDPGDRILVLPKVPGKLVDLLVSLTQILYQTAIAASVAAHY